MMSDYAPAKVSHITGLSVEEIERFAREYARAQELFGGPALIRLNYGLQRHVAAAGWRSARSPASRADWRLAAPYAGRVPLSTSKAYPFDDNYLTRPDLIPRGTRTINEVVQPRGSSSRRVTWPAGEGTIRPTTRTRPRCAAGSVLACFRG